MENFLQWLNSTALEKIPQWAIKIDLPKVEQSTPFSCGAASLHAIATFFGVGYKKEECLIDLLECNSESGTTPSNLIKVARNMGLFAFGRQGMSINSLKSRLEKRIPVICALQAWGNVKEYCTDTSGHYIVAIGFDNEKIYFEDPSMNKTRGFLPYQEFVERWHDTDVHGNQFWRFGISIWYPSLCDQKKVGNLNDSIKIE